jgi:hypothetical protein
MCDEIRPWERKNVMGSLKDAVKAVVKEGEKVFETISDAAQDGKDAVVDKAHDAANKIAAEGRKAEDVIADDLTKARGIISGAVGGIAQPGPAYEERHLTDAEKDLARTVFEETLPYGAIYLSNGLGLGRRAYTIPHPLHIGSYVIHIGPEIFRDATDSSNLMFNQTGDSVFIHELTHVWQGVNRSTPLNYIFDSVYHQIHDGSHAYDLNDADLGTKSWGKFNAEQQAMIVENWYVGGRSESDAAFPYIRDNIRTRTP